MLLIAQVSRFGLSILPKDFALVLAQANRYCNSVLFPECIRLANEGEICKFLMMADSISELVSGLPASANTLSSGLTKSRYLGNSSIT